MLCKSVTFCILTILKYIFYQAKNDRISVFKSNERFSDHGGKLIVEIMMHRKQAENFWHWNKHN